MARMLTISEPFLHGMCVIATSRLPWVSNCRINGGTAQFRAVYSGWRVVGQFQFPNKMCHTCKKGCDACGASVGASLGVEGGFEIGVRQGEVTVGDKQQRQQADDGQHEEREDRSPSLWCATIQSNVFFRISGIPL